MKKALTIGWKDIYTRLQDRGALLFLLITPLAITFLMGQVFGGDGDGGDFSLPAVPVALINHDGDGQLAEAVQRIFTENEETTTYLTTTIVTDEATARAAIQSGDSYCCLLIIPEGFSDAMLNGEPTTLTVYSDPAAPISAGLVREIARQVTTELAARTATISVTMEQLIATGRVREQEEIQAVLDELADESASREALVTLTTLTPGGEERDFDPLAYIAPGIALLFLAIGSAQGARSILDEEEMGTLSRLNTTPTSAHSIMSGKLVGIFFGGLLQFGTLMLASTVLFDIRWGDPIALAVLSVILVVAFTCLGLLLAVIARSTAQASMLGTVLSLVFAMVGGTFISRDAFPEWLRQASLVTPNAWGMEAFTKLGLGAGLSGLVPELSALLAISAIIFALGVNGYQRRVVG